MGVLLTSLGLPVATLPTSGTSCREGGQHSQLVTDATSQKKRLREQRP